MPPQAPFSHGYMYPADMLAVAEADLATWMQALVTGRFSTPTATRVPTRKPCRAGDLDESDTATRRRHDGECHAAAVLDEVYTGLNLEPTATPTTIG